MGEFIIERPNDLKELVDCISIPEIKVIMGLRRVGKSYLLKELFYKHLINTLLYEESEIKIFDLDSDEYMNVRDLTSFKKMLSEVTANTKIVIIDEIQKAGSGYENYLIDFKNLHKNLSIYITGSNSKTLSIDILRNFKEHAHRIQLRPITYAQVKKAIPDFTLDEYFEYGSLPIVLKKDKNERIDFLKELYEGTYLSDIRERCHFLYLSNEIMRNIVDRILSNLENPITTNGIYSHVIPKAMSNDAKTIFKKEISDFIQICVDSFLLINFKDGSIDDENIPIDFRNKNIKRYCFDIGLLNAISTATINKKNSCAIENMVFLELISRNIVPEGKTIVTSANKIKSIDFFYDNTFIQVEYKLDDNCYDREIGNLMYTSNDSRKINIYSAITLGKSIPEEVTNVYIEDFLSSFNYY